MIEVFINSDKGEKWEGRGRGVNPKCFNFMNYSNMQQACKIIFYKIGQFLMC